MSELNSDSFSLGYISGEPPETYSNFDPPPNVSFNKENYNSPTYNRQPNYAQEPLQPVSIQQPQVEETVIIQDPEQSGSQTLYVEGKKPFPILAVLIGIFAVLFVVGIVFILIFKTKKKQAKNTGKIISANKYGKNGDKDGKADRKEEKDNKLKDGKDDKGDKKEPKDPKGKIPDKGEKGEKGDKSVLPPKTEPKEPTPKQPLPPAK